MATVQLSDREIDALVATPEPLPVDYRARLRTRVRPYSSKHEEGQLEITTESGGAFRVIIRKNRINQLDFSAILGYVPPQRLRLLHLRRYNGVHRHTNSIEQTSFRAFHVHHATQRYQERGLDMEAYALPTEEYSTIDGALEMLLDQCGFMRPETERTQPRML